MAGDSQIRFYAGTPLATTMGHSPGALSVIDREPRELLPYQIEALKILGRQTVAQLELRLLLTEQRQMEVVL